METKIKSVSEFIEAMDSLKFSEGEYGKTQTLWFRGEGSNKWVTRLVPNSYRALVKAYKWQNNDVFPLNFIKQLEKRIESEFYRRTPRYLASRGIENSRWNRYFLMQHYKIQTRLLDWTENAMLALFFAISDTSSIKKDSVIWILRPHYLNDNTCKTILKLNKTFFIIPSANDSKEKQALINDDGEIRLRELTRRYIQMDFDGEDTLYNPLAIYPTYLDERMTAQRTCFTIFGNNIDGLISNETKSNFLKSVTIEGGSTKVRILDELRLLGIDFESIFPDLDGIGLSINSKFQKEFASNRDLKMYEREVIRNFLDLNEKDD